MSLQPAWLNVVVRNQTHPTKMLLLETAINLIDEFGPQGFTVETLLETSKISKGSLYHHFHDFSDVIEQAQVARFSRTIEKDNAAMLDLLRGSVSRDDLLARLISVVKFSSGEDRKQFRADRATIVGLSRHSKKFAEALAVEQQRITDSLADIAREMQERGWIKKNLDPRAAATFVQAYTLGFVLNDITHDPIPFDTWVEVVSMALDSILT